jgi:hypothetical protein
MLHQLFLYVRMFYLNPCEQGQIPLHRYIDQSFIYVED